uniref:Uncharacterized protein n=1 Tax=Arundo donax TaxID=35708 RepID=A0A0A9E6N3_ARUDO
MVWSSIHVARPTSSFVRGAALASFSFKTSGSGGGAGGGERERERRGRRRWSSGPASGAMRRWREKAATVWKTGASGFDPGSGIETAAAGSCVRVATRGGSQA